MQRAAPPGVGKWDTAGNQPLPEPRTPAIVTPESVGIKDQGDGISFIVLGDCGPVQDVNPQKAVAAAVQAAIAADPTIAFIFIAGDVVYFNGDPNEYMPQFWQAWARVPRPFLSVPGNHDGDPTDGVAGAGIASWMQNWCDPKGPRLPAGDPDGEFGRDTQTLPYCYWAVRFQDFLLIGLYSNVKSGGYLDSAQQAWLISTLQATAPELPVLIGLHHPPYSVDAYHGGSLAMGNTLDLCFQAANRWPTAVLAGHIHDYQRFTRTVSGKPISYIVSGDGGYHNLHEIAGDYQPGMDLGNGVTCDYADAAQWGFVQFTVKGGTVSGSYTKVPLSGTPTEGADVFSL